MYVKLEDSPKGDAVMVRHHESNTDEEDA